jgi:glucose/arabinose dehydrogenase
MMKKLVLAVFLGASLTGVLLLLPSVSVAKPGEAGLLAPPVIPGDYSLALEPVAEGLTAPNWGTFAPGEADRLFVSDQAGQLWAINLDYESKTLFLDVSDRLVDLGIAGTGTFDERGFLGFAFHPDYESNGLLYTLTSEHANGSADFSTIPITGTADHQAVVLEWQVPEPGDPEVVVLTTSAREILRVDEPQFNHNGGTLFFGPDEMLYISLGDGGAADDQGSGHSASGNGQNPLNILGAILRIDPDGSNSTNGQYSIPTDNPFVGDSDVVDEIYAYGFRNPFRFSFDAETGEMYVGDVGQNDIEEIDKVIAGGNYGWNVKEGSFCFAPNGSSPGFAYDAENCPGETPQMIDPIAEYNTSESLAENQDGRAVVGGFVYRGDRLAPLQGIYIFGDYSLFTESGVNNDGRLFYILPEASSDENGTVYEFSFADRDELGLAVLGFGQDTNGELYVMANDTGTPFGTTGVVLKIAPVRVELTTAQDNTLYEDISGAISNGTGSHFFSGKTRNGGTRRGILSFDLADKIPSGAVITSANLVLHMSRSISGDQPVSLHRVENGWGEGASNADTNEGDGAPVSSNDVTWLYRFFDTQTWINPGGDYASSPSATTQVGGSGFYTWGLNPTIVTDIQQWVDVPSDNNGWILIGNETQNQTTKRFDSKENPTEANRPLMVIEYLGKIKSDFGQIYFPLIIR